MKILRQEPEKPQRNLRATSAEAILSTPHLQRILMRESDFLKKQERFENEPIRSHQRKVMKILRQEPQMCQRNLSATSNLVRDSLFLHHPEKEKHDLI